MSDREWTPAIHPLIAQDSFMHASMLIAHLTGAVELGDLCRAIGCRPDDVTASLRGATEAGEAAVTVAIERGFQWQPLWADHQRRAAAQANSRPPGGLYVPVRPRRPQR
jgi:hypothetical protein